MIDVMTVTPNVLMSSDVNWEALFRENKSCVMSMVFNVYKHFRTPFLMGGSFSLPVIGCLGSGYLAASLYLLKYPPKKFVKARRMPRVSLIAHRGKHSLHPGL